MHDEIGNSILFNVVVSPEELSFDKRYLRRENPINYKFKRKGNLWVGKYSGMAVGEGITKCITCEVPEELYMPFEESDL